MAESIKIVNGRLLDPSTGRDETADLLLLGGEITEVGRVSKQADREIDAKGLVVVPGLLDMHTHFREPGGKAETVASGSSAAARGGFAVVVTMPNTRPAVDSAAAVKEQIMLGKAAGEVRLLPAASITKGRAGGMLAPLEEMAEAGAIAFTDDGTTPPGIDIMRKAMLIASKLGIPILDHALDPNCAGVMHDGVKSRALGLPGIPSAAEESMVERDIRLCSETGCRTHIQHLSALESVELVRKARLDGLPVSAEVTPHHLALCEKAIDGSNTNYKVNPPLRTARDMDALRLAVADGTIEAFASDHAPHSQDDKSGGFENSAFGVVGLETAVGVTYTVMARSGIMSEMEWLKRWTTGPARILGLPSPSLEPGSSGGVAVLDLKSAWTVRSREFSSSGRNTPFEGMTLYGRCVSLTLTP